MDNYNDIIYSHLQKRLTYDEAVQIKRAFEYYSQKEGIKIRHYYAKNGRFPENEFMQAVRDER